MARNYHALVAKSLPEDDNSITTRLAGSNAAWAIGEIQIGDELSPILRVVKRDAWTTWKSHNEVGASTRTAPHRDRAAVCLRDPFRDREPEAGAGSLAGARPGWVGTPESVEDVR